MHGHRSGRGSWRRAALVLLGSAGPAGVAWGQSVIPVTTTSPGAIPDGLCSLTEAIENANAGAAPHPDCAPGGAATTVELASGATYTLVLPHNPADDGTGLPVVVGVLTIDGRGASVERSSEAGTPPFRIFLVAPSGSLTLRDLHVRGGSANPDGTGLGGGGILSLGRTTLVGGSVAGNRSGTDGGGISSVRGVLVIEGSAITGNTAVNAGGGVRNAGGTAELTGATIAANVSTGTGNLARGGGLANQAVPVDAAMTVTGGVVSGNVTSGVGGGGIDNAASTGRTATLALTGVASRDNRAVGVEHFRGLGGGIQNSFFRGVQEGTARLIVDRSAITGNSAVNGGGISNGFDLAGTYALEATFTASEVSDNTAAGDAFQVGNGGGLYNLNGTLTVANSTVSGNAATGTGSPISGLGGGLMSSGLSGNRGSVNLVGSTIAGNQAAAAGSGIFAAPFDGPVDTRLVNTVVAGNAGGGCAVSPPEVESGGHNLEDGDTCQLAAPTDLVNTGPRLGALLANGGTTRTHALLPGSPAIDSGDDAACAAPPIGGVDQRGVARPQGSACDRGAYEATWAPASLALDVAFALSDGSTGTGRFVLLADGRFVDQSGEGGAWFVPQPATVAVLYDSGVACRGLWIGRFTSATQVQGLQFCLDGSGVRGVWRGTVVPAPVFAHKMLMRRRR
jgi:hypothetical protein